METARMETGRTLDRGLVLLVEDTAETRATMAELLEALGYGTVTAAAGDEALSELRRRGGEVAFLMTDLRMPGMDGEELLRRARRLRPRLPVVVASSHLDEVTVHRLEAAGAVLLHKPFTAGALRDALREAPLQAESAPALRPEAARGAAGKRLASWALAAAALVVAGLGLSLAVGRPQPPPLPLPGPDGVVRGARIELTSPRGELTAAPRELRWRQVEGAAAYRVELLAVDDAPLWRQTVSAAEAALPEDLAGRLHPGVTYRWRVEALDGGGGVLAASPAEPFRILPAPPPGPPATAPASEEGTP